jgi:2-amino-4-hydroxy-6-hydroxymethyldihydropteridine diphosphokinase
MEIGLSLGSNLGDRLANLQAARRALAAVPATALAACSPLYETDPVGAAQAFAHLRFLNAVLIVETALAVEAFAARMHAIEADLGRVRSAERNAPRVIDIDMLYAGDGCLRTETLTVPHAHWHERRFVAQPLADVRPDLVLPGQSRTVRAALAALPQAPRVTLFAKDW